MIDWLWPTAQEAASGGNGTALWCCMVASLAMLWRSWSVHDPAVGYVRQVWTGWGAPYTYLIIGLGLGLYAVRSGAWQPYYLLRATGDPAWVELALWWQMALRGPASVLTAGTALIGLLHIRYLLEPRFGAGWLGVAGAIVVAAFLAHAYLPRLL